MTLFFEKYKKLRKDQKIDLSDIENRTKINVKFLEALENGEFEKIQAPYLRLFLRAYINEIGADPDVAVGELAEFQLQKEGKKPTVTTKSDPIPEKTEDRKEEKKEIIKEKKNFGEKIENDTTIKPIEKKKFSVSPNLIKGTLFIIAWILIIFVIRYITVESEADNSGSVQRNIVDLISNFVDFEQLQSDFTVVSTQETALDINPPFVVKITSRNVLGVVSQKDSLNIESIPIAAGAQSTIYYNSKLDLILKHTNGVTVHINGETINDIKTQADPVRLTFNSNPNTLSIRHYSPIE